MPQKNKKINQICMACVMGAMLIINILFAPNNIYPAKMWDEEIWDKITHDWNNRDSYKDNKPLPFLILWKILESPYSTRALTWMIVAANTYLIYSLSKNRISFLYPVIPIFLNSMWLTTEILVSFCLLLSFRHENEKIQGWLIGLAVWFNPIAAVFVALIEKKWQALVMIAGLVVISPLWYWGRLVDYAQNTAGIEGQDWLALGLLPLFAIIGINNKKYFSFGLVACTGLLLRQWGHYFIPAYTLFFLASMTTENNREN